jgi:hypothetical protein
MSHGVSPLLPSGAVALRASGVATAGYVLGGRVLRSAAGAHPWAPGGRLQGQTGAGVHHRSSPRVGGRDDLLRGDALQVGAGRRQVGVLAELALDQRQRDPLVQQLHSVGMAELVRGQAPAHPGINRGAVQLKPRGGGRPGVAARGSDDHAKQRSDGGFARSCSQVCNADHPHGSIPTSRRRSFFPCLTRIDPRRSSRSVSVSGQRLVDPQPGAPEHDDQAVEAVTVASFLASRMTAMISSTVGGSAGYR